jgi:hypothetical protein
MISPKPFRSINKLTSTAGPPRLGMVRSPVRNFLPAALSIIVVELAAIGEKVNAGYTSHVDVVQFSSDQEREAGYITG